MKKTFREIINTSNLISKNSKSILKGFGLKNSPLVDSFSPSIKKGTRDLEIRFLLPGYAENVDKGRRKGKMPPVSAIESWTRKKGIPIKASFAIAKSIEKKGIKPKPFLHSFENTFDSRLKNISDAVLIDSSNIIDKLNKIKNIDII